MYELRKQFRFDAAHTLERVIETEPSRRIHGHSYRAEIAIRGTPDPATGMVIDLGLFDRLLANAQDGLDHRFLDEIPDLGPATLENLSLWIWNRLSVNCPGLARITVWRDSDSGACTYFGPGVEENVA
jgi:6-pyruvoyltetrahydropterin/6-carboxytetrahydropterin synthase